MFLIYPTSEDAPKCVLRNDQLLSGFGGLPLAIEVDTSLCCITAQLLLKRFGWQINRSLAHGQIRQQQSTATKYS